MCNTISLTPCYTLSTYSGTIANTDEVMILHSSCVQRHPFCVTLSRSLRLLLMKLQNFFVCNAIHFVQRYPCLCVLYTVLIRNASIFMRSNSLHYHHFKNGIAVAFMPRYPRCHQSVCTANAHQDFTTRFVRPSVGWSVDRLVPILLFLCFCGPWLHCSCQNAPVTQILPLPTRTRLG